MHVVTLGQLDQRKKKFYKKLQARQEYLEDIEAAESARVSPERPVTDLELTKRVIDILTNAEITTVKHILEHLEKGEVGLLNLDGFGRKSLADVKKGLRKFGYEIPEAATEIAV